MVQATSSSGDYCTCQQYICYFFHAIIYFDGVVDDNNDDKCDDKNADRQKETQINKKKYRSVKSQQKDTLVNEN